MIQRILKTTPSLSGPLLRLALGITILPHGIQKLTNFDNILNILESHYGLPTIIAVVVILIESLCSLLLLLGVFTRVNAVLLGIVLLGASFYHLEHGFYMNWFGSQSGEGYQFHLLYVFTAAAMAIIGGGKWSIDFMLQTKEDNR